jgi:hypothetical protein
VPAGWTPRTTVNGNLNVNTAGAVIQDYLVNGSILVNAPNVVIRRTLVQGGVIDNDNGRCQNGLIVEDTSITPSASEQYSYSGESGVIGPGGYTARRVEITRRVEGFRIGGDSRGCGATLIEDSFALIDEPPGSCSTNGWHSDGIQAYDGPVATVRHNTIDFRVNCGTAPIFIPDGDGNSSATVVNNLVMGGGFSLRVTLTSPEVSGNRIVDGSWGYGPVEVWCNHVTRWADNTIVNIDASYRVTRTVRTLTNC